MNNSSKSNFDSDTLSRRKVLTYLGAAPFAFAMPLFGTGDDDTGFPHLAPRVPKTDLGISQLSEEQLRWLRHDKFGMFIHWGLYAGPGRGEWLMHNEAILPDAYRRFAFPESGEEYFAADRFNPRAWARLAKDAGMKWMCLTTRHHDGYCLFDSPYPNAFTSQQTHHRDFVREYTNACRAEGVRVGLYYSVLSWRYPGYYDVTGTDCKRNPFGYKTDPAHHENARLMKEENYANVRHLLSSYGHIDHIFWDGGWLGEQGSDADGAYFHESGHFLDAGNAWPVGERWRDHDSSGRALGIMGIVRKHQPHVATNPRFGWMGDYMDEEGGAPVRGPVRSTALYQKCLTTAGAWGYDRGAIEGGHVMPPDMVIEYLVNCVVRDMVMLLNVGPDRHGEIPPAVATSLEKAGQWIRKAGEAIYGTRGGPWQPVDRKLGYCYRGSTIFAHMLKGYEGDTLETPAGRTPRLLRARELFTNRLLPFEVQSDGVIRIHKIDRTVSPVDTIVALEFERQIAAK
ncbi:alpha-L-fucosidase [Fimbriimonas ginsengisoli]|uniref:alpha-L-fucosidase n=1 Tax=Fimbriimonas ginsengisoli TaxID=1005039 RepID=UPI00046CC40A|nr:alpha-L-fucosidase [Fimbriimonas ginsengisoli]